MCTIIQSIMFLERVLLDQEIGALNLFQTWFFRNRIDKFSYCNIILYIMYGPFGSYGSQQTIITCYVGLQKLGCNR